MKRIILLMMMCFALGSISFAQTEVKVKKTSTIPQKVHNTFSKHKHYNGTVVKVKDHITNGNINTLLKKILSKRINSNI